MFDCVVIGAGPGGIVCLKELIENGMHNIVCIERASAIGGVFRDAYDSLILTTSAVMSMFSDFWIGDEYKYHIWSKSEALDYWQRYAEHFGVISKIRFNLTVTNVLETDSGWQVITSDGNMLETASIVIATGNNSVAKFPVWKDEITNTKVSVLHSLYYKNSDRFAGRKVLVVGGGESGADIALDIAKVARHCTVSIRNSTGWVVPRKRGDIPADIATHRSLWGIPRSHGKWLTKKLMQIEMARRDPLSDAAVKLNTMIKNPLGTFGISGTKSFALPQAMVEYSCQVVDGISKVRDGGRQLETKNGHIIDDIDDIVFCTGYTNHIDFLPESLRQIKPRSLFKHMFHPEYRERLVWLGWARSNFGSQFPIMEMQARLFVQLRKGQYRLPDRATMEVVIERDKRQFISQFQDAAKNTPSLVDYQIYIDDMARELGVSPPVWSYFLRYPRIWQKIMFGALQGTQFRLRGPGNKPAIARQILNLCPHLRLDHKLVKLGLIGRFKALIGSRSQK